MPDRIGKYELLGPIGRGGMGVVYKARDPDRARPVAIKVIASDDVSDEQRARFEREARTGVRLHHPNVVAVYELGEDAGRIFIVMEWLEGEELKRLIAQRRPLPLEAKLDLMLQVCDGLHYAHQMGIIHRDIKPANLFVLRTGQVKILDFGIARAIDSESGLTRTGLILGTLLEELARTAAPQGEVRMDLTLPDTVLARLDQVSGEARRLLETASVLGREFRLRVLAAMGDESGLEARLRELVRLELLYDKAGASAPTYLFKHALTQEVVEASLPAERRRALHGQALDAMARLAAETQAEPVERLAHHAVRAERWDAAVTYLHQAGDQALQRGAFREAAAAFRHAIQVLAHEAETDDRLRHGIDLRVALRNCLLQLGDVSSSVTYLTEAEGLARRLGDNRRLALVSDRLTHHLWITGRSREGVERGERALALDDSLPIHADSTGGPAIA